MSSPLRYAVGTDTARADERSYAFSVTQLIGVVAPSRRDAFHDAHARRRRRWRRAIPVGLIVLALSATAGLVGGYVAQQAWRKTTAQVAHRSCHQADGGDGATFTACALDVSYVGLDGRARVAHLTGVEQTRIHGNAVTIYLDSKSPPTAINPEARIPLLVFVFFGAFVWAILGGSACLLLRKPRRRPAGART